MTIFLMLLMRKLRQGGLRDWLTISQLVGELTLESGPGPSALESVVFDFYYDRNKHPK